MNKQMRLDDPQPLDRFLSLGAETTAELLEANEPIVAALTDFHNYFMVHLWGVDRDINPIVGLLGLNGHFYWLAAVRLALTGQMTGVFPLLRTGLEAHCYAWMMAKNDALIAVWLNRDDSPEALKSCRRTFTSAVSEVAKALEAEDSGAGTWVLEHYDAAIEWGGHPNVRGVFNHLRITDQEEGLKLTAVGLNGAGSGATASAIVACLDLGLAMAQVASQIVSEDIDLGTRLLALNELKVRVAEGHG